MKWIKASERLPEETRTYFVRSEDKRGVRYIVPHALDKDEFIADGFEWLEESLSEEPYQDQLWNEIREDMTGGAFAFPRPDIVDNWAKSYTIIRK